jgi:membrane peptidoglycan carboxypeptidase
MARTYRTRRAGSSGRSSRGKEPRPEKRARRQGPRWVDLRSRLTNWLAISALSLLVAALSFAAGGYLGLMESVGRFEEPANISTHPTYIYSAPVGETEGSVRVIGTIFQGENRQAAPTEEMPASLLNALVAKEDKRFREHSGVDFIGIVRALWVDIRAGEAVEGASTITQQYVRNAYLSPERSISRKLKEAAMAIEVERRYEKDEILGRYLNTVYFGNNAYGAQAAAETYFNKSAKDLTIGESATLVGLLWSPSTLGSDREAATDQRNLVLKQMFGAGYITRQDYTEALETPLPEEWPVAPMLETGLTGPQLTRNFTDLVQEELVSRFGASTVVQGGLSVYTTLDLEAQVAAQETLYGPEGYLSSPESPDAALISIEQETGRIRSLVGNRDQDARFNLVTQARRQPGSSFKPFALIAALEQGIDPDTEFVSGEKVYNIDVGTGRPERWEVENYEEAELGPISLKEALWQSDNTVFTDLITNAGGVGLEDGPERVAEVARRLGISSDFGDNPHPSIVLGAEEVSPLEMTAAYATIANGGRKVTPTAIEKVVRNEGQEDEDILHTAPQQQGEQIISPEIAAEVTEIMIGDVTRGIADKAALGERPVAGKTGTSESYFDSWFVGYTPRLTTGVWMGYAEGGQTLEHLIGAHILRQYGAVNSSVVLWHDYMEKVTEGEPVEQFEGVDANAYPPLPVRKKNAQAPNSYYPQDAAGGDGVANQTPGNATGAMSPMPGVAPGNAPATGFASPAN